MSNKLLVYYMNKVYIKNYYPFNRIMEIQIINKKYNSIIKIQKWFRYYHINHNIFYKDNEKYLIHSRYNMRKMIILYLNHPTIAYFKEYPIYYMNNQNSKYKYLLLLLKLNTNKYKMYTFIKNMKYEMLKNLYLQIKQI